ncbi:hypothetical protein LguiA_007739 [Lonicera macranthoides]
MRSILPLKVRTRKEQCYQPVFPTIFIDGTKSGSIAPFILRLPAEAPNWAPSPLSSVVCKPKHQTGFHCPIQPLFSCRSTKPSSIAPLNHRLHAKALSRAPSSHSFFGCRSNISTGLYRPISNSDLAQQRLCNSDNTVDSDGKE